MRINRSLRVLGVPVLLAALLAESVVPLQHAAARQQVAAPMSLELYSARASVMGITARVFASGSHLQHPTPKRMEALSDPDDITSLDGDIFVGFQNGVGSTGAASKTGNLDSTVVEFDMRGGVVRQWDIRGKCDGLSAAASMGKIVATVNEDGNSSVYLIDPASAQPIHYSYNESLPHNGGTDAPFDYKGEILISASAPGSTGKPAPQAAYPALYRTGFDAKTHVATVHPLFSDEATATVANTNMAAHGTSARLALTDPDSNLGVPTFAARFGGDFMLDSQGDKEEIYVDGAGAAGQTLAVLHLSESVDDTAWAPGPSGALYTADQETDSIYRLTGPFQRGEAFVAVTPCDAGNAPSTCPAPGFPDNYLGRLDLETGAIARVAVAGPVVAPHSLLFVP